MLRIILFCHIGWSRNVPAATSRRGFHSDDMVLTQLWATRTKRNVDSAPPTGFTGTFRVQPSADLDTNIYQLLEDGTRIVVFNSTMSPTDEPRTFEIDCDTTSGSPKTWDIYEAARHLGAGRPELCTQNNAFASHCTRWITHGSADLSVCGNMEEDGSRRRQVSQRKSCLTLESREKLKSLEPICSRAQPARVHGLARLERARGKHYLWWTGYQVYCNYLAWSAREIINNRKWFDYAGGKYIWTKDLKGIVY
ncbi:hypothetical protein HOY80DRAFT_1082750 [Tuber brumale]|nr:hypothetical protein HOY80DRAFT_1082750 [Tuber brumale]